jgi:hypothetical protein
MKYRAVAKGEANECSMGRSPIPMSYSGNGKGTVYARKGVSLDVELDLGEEDEKKPQWTQVRLLFVRRFRKAGEADV